MPVSEMTIWPRSVLGLSFYSNFAVGAIEFDRVIQQVDENLFQLEFFAQYLNVVQFVAQQTHAAHPRTGFHGA